MSNDSREEEGRGQNIWHEEGKLQGAEGIKLWYQSMDSHDKLIRV